MNAAARRTRFRVEGMDCASCANKIRTALERLPGVSDVRVSVMSETLALALDERVHDAASEVRPQHVPRLPRALGDVVHQLFQNPLQMHLVVCHGRQDVADAPVPRQLRDRDVVKHVERILVGEDHVEKQDAHSSVLSPRDPLEAHEELAKGRAALLRDSGDVPYVHAEASDESVHTHAHLLLRLTLVSMTRIIFFAGNELRGSLSGEIRSSARESFWPNKESNA